MRSLLVLVAAIRAVVNALPSVAQTGQLIVWTVVVLLLLVPGFKYGSASARALERADRMTSETGQHRLRIVARGQTGAERRTGVPGHGNRAEE